MGRLKTKQERDAKRMKRRDNPKKEPTEVPKGMRQTKHNAMRHNKAMSAITQSLGMKSIPQKRG